MSTEVMTAIAPTDTAVDTAVDTVVDTAVEITIDPMVRQLNSMTELLDVLGKTSKALTAEMKIMVRDVNKMRIAASKKGKRVKKVIDPDAPRKLGALEKPVPITEELAVFLELTKGEMYSRQVITQTINKYVKAHDLQNPENRRYILLESEAGLKLKALLRDPDQPLTFFNIQRYLKVHYPKVEPVEGTEPKTTVTKGKTVEVESTPESTPESTDRTTTSDTPSASTDVVADSATVDETPGEAPKKKVIRKVVKKA